MSALFRFSYYETLTMLQISFSRRIRPIPLLDIPISLPNTLQRGLSRLGWILSCAWLGLAASGTVAETCVTDSLSAHYQISVERGEQAVTKSLVLYRHQGLIAHHFADKNITEIWERNHRGHARVTRFFEPEQRGIEYASNEVGGAENDDDWSAKAQLIADSRIAAMKLVASNGQGCERSETYRFNTDKGHTELQWLPEQRLIQSLELVHGEHYEHWQLLKVSRDTAAIAKYFNQRFSYQTTDYADIGDNESDPFLMNMIRLGFIKGGASGMYDADGHALSGGHQH